MIESWKVGREGCVVSNMPTHKKLNTGHGDLAYYGGYLVCESIPSTKIANLIAAAPDAIEVLKSLENDNSSIPKAIWDMRNNAIAKAESEY